MKRRLLSVSPVPVRETYVKKSELDSILVKSNIRPKVRLRNHCRWLFLMLLVCILVYFGWQVYLSFNRQRILEGNFNDAIRRHMLPVGKATENDYYITRPNGRDDGGEVRVMFAITSNRVDLTVCYAVASAYFTNIPIVVVGYDDETYNHMMKFDFVLKALDSSGLHDSDVFLQLDADIMFTGLDYLPFIDKFIKESPASLNELDAKAIRTGGAMAPSIYGVEGGCWSPQAFTGDPDKCHNKYYRIEQQHENYLHGDVNRSTSSFHYQDNELFFNNAGTSIHRVWALREFLGAIVRVQTNYMPINGDKEWKCDQSIVAGLYTNLRMWEIEEDYYHKSNSEIHKITNEFGLHAGLISLDLANELSATLWPIKTQNYELTTELWSSAEFPKTEILQPYSPHVATFTEMLIHKRDKLKLFTERKLNRSYSSVHNITIAPPLLSAAPRHCNGEDKSAIRTFPWLTHYAGPEKLERYSIALNYMQWYLPMMFDNKKWERGKEYLMTMPIEMWTEYERQRIRYGDVCTHHPFNRLTSPRLKKHREWVNVEYEQQQTA